MTDTAPRAEQLAELEAWHADPEAQAEFRAWLATLPEYCAFCGGPLAHCRCGPFSIEDVE